MSQLTPNPNQQRAIAWQDGPLFVRGGPGAGKTFVLTERVIRLIRESPGRHFAVLGLSFTNKAADEMRQRVRDRLDDGKWHPPGDHPAERARLMTFYAFCDEVLRQHGSHIGLRTDFRLLTLKEDRWKILESAGDRMRVEGAPAMPVRRKSRLLGRLLRFVHEDDDLLFRSPLGGGGWKRRLVASYVRELVRQNWLDYDALPYCCLRLVHAMPPVADFLRTVYPQVCVDEYQDTTEVQDRLLRHLAPPPDGNLFAVGDGDQILYEWSGASPRRLPDLLRDYRMEVLELPESYRCPEATLELANRLIRRNRERTAPERPLVGRRPGRGAETVRLAVHRSPWSETRWVAHDIRRRELAGAECAVLARGARLVNIAYRTLANRGIPAFRIERKSDFDSPGVRFVSDALRLADAPTQPELLGPLCRSFFDLSGIGVAAEEAGIRAEVEGGSLLAGFADAASEAWSVHEDAEALLKVLRKHLVERPDYPRFVAGAFALLEAENHGWNWNDEVRGATLDEIGAWRELTDPIRSADGSHPPLTRFLQELDLRPIEPGPNPEDIQCLTVHQAKGRQFRHVYLLGLAEDQLPSFYARAEGSRIEEERRTCFVAITRASETLTLSYARSYFGRRKRPSRFLGEMGLDAEGTGSPAVTTVVSAE